VENRITLTKSTDSVIIVFMKTVTTHQAKTHLSRLLREVQAGEEVVIARGDTPLARLVPVVAAPLQRRFGTARGLVSIADDFDQPLADFDEYR
jgi:prevent-host-death family protein